MEFDDDEWKTDNIKDIFNMDNSDLIQRDRLILKNIPAEFTREGLRNMCESYGTIVEVMRPPEQSYAFVQFKSAAEAENLLRRFSDDIQPLKIIAEYARNRQKIPRLPHNLDFLNECPNTVDSDAPLRNVIELDKRMIRGPFGDPIKVQNGDSLISLKDYSSRNLLLKCADPTREYLWDSNDEVAVDCEFNEYRKKIVHGRAIFLSVDNNDSPTTNNSDKKLYRFNSHLIPNIELCANCTRPADKNCKNCEKLQCSLQCHATACKSPDKKHDPVQSGGKVQQIKNMVKITAVINHRLVFLRPGTDSDDIEFARINCDTVRCATDADTLTFLPQIGSLVLAKFDFYQRALVLKHVSNTTVAVVFIDYGNVETREFHELKALPEKLKTIKRFASKFALNNIEHDIINFAAVKVLYRYMAKETELRFELNVDNHSINLKASDKWVNELVNQMNIQNIKRQCISSITDRIFFNSVPNKPIDNEKLRGKEVIILDNSQVAMKDLTFIDASDLKLWCENDRRIQNTCNYLFKKDEYYTPLNNECCVVKFQNRWYRAYCVEIAFDGYATMQFIDFGNMKPIEINDVRPIPEVLLFECVTITVDCFTNLSLDALDDPKKLLELKELYPIQSRHKIERIDIDVEIDMENEQHASIFASLKKI